MRRKDREMPKNFAFTIVDKCEWAVISMVDKQGKPYCSALSIARENNVIYFHSAKAGYKIDCLKHLNDVCISCISDTYRLPNKFTTEYNSAIVKGKAVEITDKNEMIHALKLICLRHTPTNMGEFDNSIANSLSRTAVWKVEIEEITGKSKKYDEKGKELKFRNNEG